MTLTPRTAAAKDPGADGSRTGAQIICEALVREGVEIMFGIPGGAIMPFYHAMWEYRDQIRHVLCRHEQGAGHAAEGYARTTGRVGVCIATSGPGATNLVTPIADAWMDSTPMIAITGQVSSAALGTDAFQETDITGITVPITKHNYLVQNVEDIAYVVKEAFYLARSGRPGPVLIDVTKDAQQARTIPRWDRPLRLPRHKSVCELDRGAIERATALLCGAQRPLIMAGNGVVQSGASAELRALAERTGIPVITTLHGKGAFPESHELSLGMSGMHGWVHVNKAIQECDVLFNVGGRFDDRVTGKVSTFAPRAQIIHVDIDPSEIGKVVPTSIGIRADARAALTCMLETAPAGNKLEWLDRIRANQKQHEPHQAYRRRPETPTLMPHDVFASLDRAFHRHTGYRVVTDVGQHQMWAAQLIEWGRPRTHITSGGAGTMGFSIPAALGAALAFPNETIWVIVGDGGFQMTNQEIATMVQEDVRNVKIAVINNGYLGMVRQWQELFEGARYSGTKLSGPDISLLAEAYGVRGIKVERPEDADEAIESAWAHHGPVVIDFRVEREANVFPIVPAGQSISNMMVTATANA